MKMLPVNFAMTGNKRRRQLSLASRRELIEALAGRYRAAGQDETPRILDGFTQVTGFHRQHAIRVLGQKARLAPRHAYDPGCTMRPSFGG